MLSHVISSCLYFSPYYSSSTKKMLVSKICSKFLGFWMSVRLQKYDNADEMTLYGELNLSVNLI